MVQSFMAGIYISTASHVYLAVGGGVLGSALFPMGLIAVVITSAELFTGDALVFAASILGGRVTFGKLLQLGRQLDHELLRLPRLGVAPGVRLGLLGGLGTE